MEQQSTNNYLKEVQKDLFSGNNDVILERIENIKENGNPEVIEMLLDLYILTSDNDIKKSIFDLLSDLKISIAADALVSLIEKPKYKTIKKDLIVICWQSRLDYSKHISIFANSLINDDFETAIEAYTLIDENLGNLSIVQKSVLATSLQNGLENQPREKAELIHFILDNISESNKSISLDIQ